MKLSETWNLSSDKEPALHVVMSAFALLHPHGTICKRDTQTNKRKQNTKASC